METEKRAPALTTNTEGLATSKVQGDGSDSETTKTLKRHEFAQNIFSDT